MSDAGRGDQGVKGELFNSPSAQSLVTAPSHQPCSLVRKTELREVKRPARRRTASTWPSWDPNVKRDGWVLKFIAFSLGVRISQGGGPHLGDKK